MYNIGTNVRSAIFVGTAKNPIFILLEYENEFEFVASGISFNSVGQS